TSKQVTFTVDNDDDDRKVEERTCTSKEDSLHVQTDRSHAKPSSISRSNHDHVNGAQPFLRRKSFLTSIQPGKVRDFIRQHERGLHSPGTTHSRNTHLNVMNVRDQGC
uniref:Uncharacterized protein n=1 Tax=Parascaris univalens TaxID=6257 RepID=A0A915C6J9_PARUN